MRTKIIQINVTNHRIKTGIRSACKKCPIALAITARLKNKYFAEVQPVSIRIRNRRDGCYYWEYQEYTPWVALGFIEKFDNGEKVKPFRFSLEIPVKFLRPR